MCLASHLFSKTVQNEWCLKIFQGNLHTDWRWEPDLVLWVTQLDFLPETLWKWSTAVGTHGTGDCPGSVRAALVLRFAEGQNRWQAACGGPHSWPACPIEWTPRRRTEHLWQFLVKAAKSRLDCHFHIQSRTSGRSWSGFVASSRLLERDIHAVLKRNGKNGKNSDSQTWIATWFEWVSVSFTEDGDWFHSTDNEFQLWPSSRVTKINLHKVF